MPETPLATQPERSFSVLASAGTGKTWQLVARLVRLLLQGARLDSILAITFTRKAAGEMQLRLNERLQELLEAEQTALDAILTQIGEAPSTERRNKARNLLEQWLRSESTLRTTTFHSFCRELLQRFPLEAGLPPAFELAEQTGLLIQESWEALFSEATVAPDQPLAAALELLFENLNGLHNTRNALFDFVEHRSDWWAFTHRSGDPVQAATQRLQDRLAVDRDTRAGGSFWDSGGRQDLADFAALLACHATKTNQDHAATITCVLSRNPDAETAAADLQPVFFTTSGERRKRSSTNAQRRAMTETGEKRFLQLHERFCEQLEAVIEQQRRRQTLRTNAAWYAAGQRMLEHYQRIKRERRLLDFADLEWNTYLLLSHPEHAHWIQFKLDQRINHLLIDEFQDTNPTQWQLILPLLEEMAAGDERQRSLFIVGDEKQSIYRFRRGNPRLLGCASAWMQTHLNASQIHLDASRRSSPAVLDVVNQVFLHPQMHPLLPGFQVHSTHQTGAWGRVEFWPLVEAENDSGAAPCTALRNPLQQPRAASLDQRHYREGQAIAQRITQLVRQLDIDYGDILILMRSRTHLHDYEAALRDGGIPYLSLDRGTLLQSLEIRDLEALLVVLMTPQDNLSLAQVLRSPIFSAEDEDLMLLAGAGTGAWIERLAALAPTLPQNHRLARANRLLDAWRALAGRVPIHDLLERIFHQANLPERYRAAFPVTEAARVEANLTRFVELALEVDSGRYPTLPRFLARVRQLRNLDREGPSQAPPSAAAAQRVRLLTVHAAKGLEAPVVFLADSTNEGSTPNGCRSLVRWPAEADRPTDFMLLSAARRRDDISRALEEVDQQEERRESANLLYVALTRARHALIISGCAQGAQGRSKGWYQQMAQALFDQENPAEIWVHEFLDPPEPQSRPGEVRPAALDVDPRLRGTITTPLSWREIAPSRAEEDQAFQGGDAFGATRGLIIHRMLELAADSGAPARGIGTVAERVAVESGRSPADPMLQACRQEVERLLTAAHLAWLFQPPPGAKAYSEVPIEYLDRQQTVFGVIDRLLVCDGIVHLIDYKTHRVRDEPQLRRLADRYRAQLALYREGVRRLWADHRVQACLLFTHVGKLVEID